ncbi:hypothetical protein AYK21_03905 [Thermoplasmatales archaeon SG8-52-2]|nr:MAG: hypothetical protein AYK21_03905 [Thermoplasmatales archaeon SG8-52-2]
MKYLKPRFIIVSSVVALLVLSSVGSFGISNSKDDIIESNRLILNKSAVCINSVSYDMETNTLGTLGNVSYDNIRNTKDYGQNWSIEKQVIAKLNQIPIKDIDSPSLCITPLSNKAYGMYKSPRNNSGVFGYLEIDDISNLDNFYTSTFAWVGFEDQEDPSITYDFWDFDSPKIISYDDTKTPWVIAIIGSTNYSFEGVGPCTDAPMFCFNDLVQPERFVTLTWYSEIEHCSNISITNDYGDKMVYGICEINNGSKQDLLFFKGNPQSWYNGNDLINQTISTSSSLTHPNIYVVGDNVYVVADSESEGIVILNSSDNGDTWQIKDELELFCTYIESENIFMTSSIDDGYNWSEPMQLNSVNNSVVENFRYSNMFDDKHILWTDDRNKSSDIYSVVLEVPGVDLTVLQDSIDIECEFKDMPLLRMKNWITFTIKNNGNIFVENVIINITYDCVNETSKQTDYRATLHFLRPGEEETFRRPLFRLNLAEFFNALIDFAGIETLTVTIDPKYKDINPDDNIQSISVTYKDIFPRMGFLEPIFSIL